MSGAIDLTGYRERAKQIALVGTNGKVVDVVGLTLEATGPDMNVGEFCHIRSRSTGERIPAEVVGFRGPRILLMPLGEMHGVGPRSWVIPTGKPQMARVGHELLGRVLDSMGRPLDGGAPISCVDERPLVASPPHPMRRMRITEPMATGVRSIDSCITLGKGQRMGIMSGSGVGKSKLLGMIARGTQADINVIALIGERGREVRDFIEADLGPEGLARSVVVVATSDEPALMRIKGAYLATAIAEWFRDQGRHVMLMMDSVTRFAMAQREVGLAVGEPPTTKGYPPSVFALLPKLLERAGTSGEGSVTGLYSVLVEADDLNDPIGDAVRSILDGHIVLSRALATRGHFPAVDVLESISRVMPEVVTPDHLPLSTRLRSALATYRDAEDLINIGAYARGSNPDIDASIDLMPRIRAFLQQSLHENSPWEKLTGMMRYSVGG